MCAFVSYLTESCSEEAAHAAVRTLIDLGVSDSLYIRVSLNLSVENYSLTQDESLGGLQIQKVWFWH